MLTQFCSKPRCSTPHCCRARESSLMLSTMSCRVRQSKKASRESQHRWRASRLGALGVPSAEILACGVAAVALDPPKSQLIFFGLFWVQEVEGKDEFQGDFGL